MKLLPSVIEIACLLTLFIPHSYAYDPETKKYYACIKGLMGYSKGKAIFNSQSEKELILTDEKQNGRFLFDSDGNAKFSLRKDSENWHQAYDGSAKEALFKELAERLNNIDRKAAQSKHDEFYAALDGCQSQNISGKISTRCLNRSIADACFEDVTVAQLISQIRIDHALPNPLKLDSGLLQKSRSVK